MGYYSDNNFKRTDKRDKFYCGGQKSLTTQLYFVIYLKASNSALNSHLLAAA